MLGAINDRTSSAHPGSSFKYSSCRSMLCSLTQLLHARRRNPDRKNRKETGARSFGVGQVDLNLDDFDPAGEERGDDRGIEIRFPAFLQDLETLLPRKSRVVRA